MREKLCVFCTNYVWSEPYEYSEHTFGGGYMSCDKQHIEAGWTADDSLEELRKAITFAKDCPDYDEAKP